MWKGIVLWVLLIFSSLGVKAQTTTQKVQKLLDKYKVEHKEVWLAVFRQESGSGTSNLAVKYLNLWGMKYPNKRTTTANGKTKGGYATYKSLEDSVLDIRLYQLTYLKGYSKQQTLKYLRTVYIKDRNYLKNILGE